VWTGVIDLPSIFGPVLMSPEDRAHAATKGPTRRADELSRMLSFAAASGDPAISRVR